MPISPRLRFPGIGGGVVAFSNGGLVVEPPTNDQAAILAAIERLSPQGGTSLGQGIFAALNAIAGEALAIDEAALEEGTAIGICLVAWQTSGMQPDAGPAPAA